MPKPCHKHEQIMPGASQNHPKIILETSQNQIKTTAKPSKNHPIIIVYDNIMKMFHRESMYDHGIMVILWQ